MAEKRWIVLSGDGRHMSVGRYTDPSEEEIGRMKEGLRTQGLTGWLAVMSGSYYRREQIDLVQVRPLVLPEDKQSNHACAELWSAAVGRFQAIRSSVISSL